MRRTFARVATAKFSGNTPLCEHDPEVHALLQRELHRQVTCIELIASENFTSRAVLECLGSVATNKYAEGLPGARYYGGTEVIDEIENLCRTRALQAYSLNPKEWGVNVQPYSGSPANFAAYSAVLRPHDRIMGLDLPCGGHLTHGFYTANRRVSGSSIYFESLPYRTTAAGLIDFDNLELLSSVYKPKLIIAGGSAYPRDWDYARFRNICDRCGALLLVDMAHISGLVAAKEHASPFEHADLVTTTTHKSLRGPRSGMIFFRKDGRDGKGVENLEEKVNSAVFPMLQGGPHEHQIAALATQLKEVMTDSFVEYIRQVKKNAAVLAEGLMKKDNTVVSNGTENHLVLWDLRNRRITGSKIEKVLDLMHITTNKNSVAGDKSAIIPGGLRLGTPAMTTRGFNEKEMLTTVEFLERGVTLACQVQDRHPKAKLAEFVKACAQEPAVLELAREVQDFASQFPFPGTESPFPLK